MRIIIGLALMVGGGAVAYNAISSGNTNTMAIAIGILATVLGGAVTFFKGR